MISEALLSVLFAIGNFLISLLHDTLIKAFEGGSSIATVIAYALVFFPSDVWLFGLGAVVTMMSVTLVYALLEWVWKKVPGVD